MKKKLFYKIYPAYLLLIVVPLLIFIWYFSYSLEKFFLRNAIKELSIRANLLKTTIEENLFVPQNRLHILLKKIGKSSNTRITIIDLKGKVVADSSKEAFAMDNHLMREEVQAVLRGEKEGSSIRYSTTLKMRMIYLAIKLNSNPPVVVRVSTPLNKFDSKIASMKNKVLIFSSSILFLILLISFYITKRIVKPIESLRVAAISFANGDLKYRPEESSIKEISELSYSMKKMAKDIEKKIEETTKQKKEYETLFTSMTEAIIAFDSNLIAFNANKPALKMLNRDINFIKGKTIIELIRNIELKNFFYEATHLKQKREKEIRIYNGNEEKVYNVTISTILSDKNRRIGFLLILNDKTKIVELENIRKKFVANASHELKTPLTTIRGFVETLLNEKVEEEDRVKFLKILLKHTNRLSKIVNDLLDISKIENEETSLATYFYSVEKILLSAIEVLKDKASDKNITLKHSCLKDMVASINPYYMERAVTNLIDNAIDYSKKEGLIEIKAEKESGKTVISVVDQGIGIAEEEHKKIFERFYRVDKSRDRKKGGTGLGLSIVKHIVKLHKGAVEVESVLGKGSTFKIILPD